MVPKRYSIHVNGPWCIIFEWEDGDSLKVNLELFSSAYSVPSSLRNAQLKYYTIVNCHVF